MAEVWSGFDLFTPAGRGALMLTTLRVTGVVWTAPLFSARTIPVQVKAAVTVVLVAVLLPVMGEAAPLGVPAVLGEVLVGMTLGLGAAIFVAAAESAGDMLAVQMGLSGANVLDPSTQTQLPVLGHFLGLFVTALILATGGHLFILGALASSVELIPLGAGVAWEAGSWTVVQLGGTLLALGLKFAAPVIAAMMIGNAALGVLARTVPQLNVLAVAFPLQIGIGLMVLGVTLPLIAGAFAGFGDTYREVAGGLLERLAIPAEGGA